MSTSVQALPKFRNGQRVRFLGGEGIIQTYYPEAKAWTYAVKMAMAPEPDFGRVGGETTILMSENDIELAKEWHHETHNALQNSLGLSCELC